MDEQATPLELQTQNQVKQPPGYGVASQLATGAVPQAPTVDTLIKMLSETHQTLQEAEKLLSDRYNALTGCSPTLLNSAINQTEKQVDASIAGLINEVRSTSIRLQLLINKF